MTREELVRHLAGLHDEQLKLRLRQASESLPNPLRLRMLRRDVARCQFVLAEMDRNARPEAAVEKAQ